MVTTFIVDWDGVCVEDGHYPDRAPWLPGAVDGLKELLQHGKVKISTCRNNPYEAGHDQESGWMRPVTDQMLDEQQIRNQLDEAGLHEVEVHRNNGKPAGDFYIDDKAVKFIGWEETIKVLTKIPMYRTFETGATRDTDQDKLDPEAAISPLVVKRYCEFKRSHRHLPDGSLRPDDGWQLGIPVESYAKSLQRHNLDVWLLHRGWKPVTETDLETALCAVIFNASGWLHELLKGAA